MHTIPHRHNRQNPSATPLNCLSQSNMEPTLMLKFATEGLDLHDKSVLISDIFKEVKQTVNVTDIIGVQLLPKQWPHDVEIVCANEATKDILLNNELKIQNQDIKMYETGLNKVKAAIDNAPLNMDNGIIKEAVCEFGKVLDIRNGYLSVGGKKGSMVERNTPCGHVPSEMWTAAKSQTSRWWKWGKGQSVTHRTDPNRMSLVQGTCCEGWTQLPQTTAQALLQLWKHHSSKGGVCCGESVLQLQREQPHHTQLPLLVPGGDRGYPRDHTHKDKCNKLWWHWKFPSLDEPCSTAGAPNQPRKWTRHGSWPLMRWFTRHLAIWCRQHENTNS